MKSEVAAPPIPASTVLLLRDGEDGAQVLMLRRPSRSSFAARAFVFPGGAVDTTDGDDELMALAPDFNAAAAATRLDIAGADATRISAAYHLAAIREVFEETGVLIGRNNDGRPLVPADRERLTSARRDLLGGAAFHRVLRVHALHLSPELLLYSARFVTPDSQPKRFDTRFFATLAGTTQEASMHDAEATEGGWYRPADVLEQADAQPMLLLPPTRIMCRKVAQQGSAAAALAALSEQPIDASSLGAEALIRWAMDDGREQPDGA